MLGECEGGELIDCLPEQKVHEIIKIISVLTSVVDHLQSLQAKQMLIIFWRFHGLYSVEI